MGKKVLINERQLALLVNYINENEYKPVINEELLEEGLLKNITLAAAFALGLNVGNAQDRADKLMQNDNLRAQVNNTLKNDEGIKDLASALKIDANQLKGYMQKNADQIGQTFDRYENKKNLNINIQQKDSEKARKSVLSKLKTQGYAVTGIETLIDTVVTYPNEPVVMSDTLSLDFGGTEGAETLGHALSSENISAIQDLLKTIETSNGKINSITILAKTDAERTPSYKSDSDPTGNYTLAKKRAEEAKNAIAGSGIDFGGVAINVDDTSAVNSGLASGSQELKSAQDEFNTNREKARKDYAQDRGVEIIIDYEYNSQQAGDVEPEIKIEKIVRVSYAKADVYKTGGKDMKKTNGKTKVNVSKCKIKVGKVSSLACPEFN